jgi:hypothetical protein
MAHNRGGAILVQVISFSNRIMSTPLILIQDLTLVGRGGGL